MKENKSYRLLDKEEIQLLTSQGCNCDDWSQVQVTQGFDPLRVRNVSFDGQIQLGDNQNMVTDAHGLNKPCGIYNAYLIDCTIGNDVRIANIGSQVANYVIEDAVCIEDVGTMYTQSDATFGNGVEIEVLNEGGGREVPLFNLLDSQFAHLLCLHRYRPKLIERLQSIARAEVAKVKSDRGTIGTGVSICQVKEISDVNIGPYAVVHGTTSLVNGTVLSSKDAPTIVGVDVNGEDFIIAEGSRVESGAIVCTSFIGQGCKIGKQFSTEGSLFFSNCEGFHGEACSVFAGPYTVTHHKSTLLIAGLFSFYNAGSGTNQSNHLYKLGPVHEGRLERGCKTGSFSYMMWPCRIGPFSVVLGKHTRTFDTSDFPFSYLESSPEGRCLLTPGFNLTTVGTVRDGAKWPARDRRQGSDLRDRISFDVFSPLTVGRMMAGSAQMKDLQDNTDRSVATVNINGTDVKRVLLRTCRKFYRSAIHMYLLDKVVARVEQQLRANPSASLTEALAPSADSVFSQQWFDIGGQMMPKDRLDSLHTAIEDGSLADLQAVNAELNTTQAAYDEDEWAWVCWAYQQVFETDLKDATADDLIKIADGLKKAREKFLVLVLNDAVKEFNDSARTGFGYDGADDDAAPDFAAVRGEYESNKFVTEMRQSIADLGDRVEQFKQAISK